MAQPRPVGRMMPRYKGAGQEEAHEGKDHTHETRSRSPSPESDPRRSVASPEGDADEVHDEEELAEAALEADAGVGAGDLLPSQGALVASTRLPAPMSQRIANAEMMWRMVASALR